LEVGVAHQWREYRTVPHIGFVSPDLLDRLGIIIDVVENGATILWGPGFLVGTRAKVPVVVEAHTGGVYFHGMLVKGPPHFTNGL
jgi:hypothetical protein